MKSKVYFMEASADEPADVLAAKSRDVYLAAGLNELITAGDFVALKIHFGEAGNKGHIEAAWLPALISKIKERTKKVFLTDSNTLYVGNRSNAVDHIMLAWDHGFRPETVGVPVIIADGLIGRDKLEAGGEGLQTPSSRIAGAILDSDVLVCLTHVTGHIQTGLGAAIKNLGMGCASRTGKLDQHSVVHPSVVAKACRNCGTCRLFCPAGAIVQAEGHVRIDGAKCIGCGECLVVCKVGAIKMKWNEDSRRLQEKMAEYALRVLGHFKGRAVFINYIMKVTKDCDCMARKGPRIVEDIGIVSSLDPVAVDKATVDLMLERGGGRDVLRAGYDIDWSIQLDYGAGIGLGSTDYQLVRLGGPRTGTGA